MSSLRFISLYNFACTGAGALFGFHVGMTSENILGIFVLCYFVGGFVCSVKVSVLSVVSVRNPVSVFAGLPFI
jgi:hypothetical protein